MVGGVFTTVLEGNAVEQMPPLFSLLYRGNADGIHVQCRFCDHKPFNSVHCPPSARPNYQDGECWFPQGTAQSYKWDTKCMWGILGRLAVPRRCVGIVFLKMGTTGFGNMWIFWWAIFCDWYSECQFFIRHDSTIKNSNSLEWNDDPTHSYKVGPPFMLAKLV